MSKRMVVFLVLCFSVALASLVFAEDFKIKDMPDSHWAAWAVYDLVKMGVTKGYPDGTFRGTNKITRYETAIFLAKLARAIGAEDLKADIKALKEEITSLKGSGGGALSGSYSADWKIGNLLSTGSSGRGMVASYRLKLSTEKNIAENSNVKVNLDTMDYGYLSDGSSTAGGILATELLDLESNLRVNLSALGIASPIDLKLSYGPGPRTHEADPTGILPSEAGVTYVRPYTGVVASTDLWGAKVSGGYLVRGKTASGKVDVSDITGSIGYVLERVPLVNTLKIEATGDYISSGMYSSSSKDMRASIALAAPLSEKVEASGTLGLAGSSSSNLMLAGSVALKDLFDTGTVAKIKASKIGSSFINSTFAAQEFNMAGFDTFNRPLENSTVNLGGEVTQTVSPDVKLVGKGDLRLSSDYKYEAPYGRLTAQGGISYAIAPNTSLDAMYRIFQSKLSGDTSDIAALGLLYNF